MYLLDGDYGKLQIEPVGYTRNQLQVVTETEQKPTPAFNTIEENRYEVEKLLDAKNEGRTKYLLVKWKGYPRSESTWQKRTSLMKEIPQMIINFEKKQKEKENKK